MKKQIRNVAASHRAKLLALARTRGEDFQFLLGRWIIERFLYRLAGSKHKEYEGVRVWVAASLDGARATMQIDVGFGDAVDPAPAELPFPTLLPLDAPVIRAYPPEAVIAEKLQAMVALGMANSRMKDFFDIWTFAITQHFDAARLSQSIRRTFEQRRTGLPATPPVALTDEFLLDTVKRTQWAAFCKRLGLHDTPALDAIGPVLIRFLMPVVEQARQQERNALIWEPSGPWRKAERKAVE
ncbi:MAG: nucleotidyl transferase AbiEii/AbiGii toxin family protein [Bryobacteraceae bacterium]|nr:nucleotidyl transferase AbiEii/AbiGii toxin family protein [Bryobacteraceae bacterium]